MMQEVNEKSLPREKLKNVDYSEKVLEVKNLKMHFYLGSGVKKTVVPAVDNVTFDVYKREVFGLVGESGCGKTTTGRTIIKLYKATEGTVSLNGVLISAGYQNLVSEIKQIKKQVKEAILSLDQTKSQAIQLQRDANFKIELIQNDIQKLKKTYKQNIEKAKTDFYEYKDKVYNLKNQYLLDISNIKYHSSLEKAKILKKLTNQFEIDYQNDLKIAKNTFDRKVDGLKNSAALSKEVIKTRIEDLKKEYEEQIIRLKEEYTPLIESEKGNILPKEEVKAQIKVLKEETKKKLLARKHQYKAEQVKIKAPNMKAIKDVLKELKGSYNRQLKALKASIKKVKAETKNSIARLPKSAGLTDEQREKAIQIKMEGKEKIAELKQKIREIKIVNNSKDTLKASQKMQMIFQDPISSLNPRMTVREIVGEGLKIQGGYDSETINKLVAEALEVVGLSPDYATRYPHEFSGGQRQRIGIARALIMNPSFIIADEPISSLDVSIRAQIINLLTDLKDELGLTILFIAHDLSVVRFFCDRIAVMYYGKIVELAPSEELFKNPQHPYTISLLSAIPQPDPDYEKGRKRIHYDPSMHDYTVDKPELKEISEGHFVYANNKEFEIMKENYGKKSYDFEPDNPRD